MSIDPTLIELSPKPHGRAFFCAWGAAFLLLTVAWFPFADQFLRFKVPFSFTTGEDNVVTLTRAMRTPNMKVAIVGSSLASRLDANLFKQPGVGNLSVGGGSAMTGLELLAQMKQPPQVVLVEINIMDRRMDAEWKNQATGAADSRLGAIMQGLIKPIRYLLSKPVFAFIPPGEQRAWWTAKRSQDLAKEVATYDIDNVVAEGVRSWDLRSSWELAENNAKRIQQLTAILESRGAKVYLMYLPMVAAYDGHAYARRNREIAAGNDAFQCPHCLDIRHLVDVTRLRWLDGVHLDDRSALLVVDVLEAKLSSDIK